MVLADGHVYERGAIRRWLRDHDTSPKTNRPVPRDRLVPCHALRAIISDVHHRHPAAAASAAPPIPLLPPPPPPAVPAVPAAATPDA